MNNIQKAIVFYFSGTGNAERIALWFSEFAVKKGIDCEIFDIAKCEINNILISPVALGYYLIGRFALAKSFFASSDCDSCGLCIKQCPVQAIKMVNKHPFWTFKCESCMHCMNNCPKRAIETAHGLIVIVSMLSSFGLTILLQSVLQLEIKSSFIRLTIWSVIFIAILWILYYIQHLLMRYRIMSKLVSLTSLTHYKFWGRYKSIPDKKWNNERNV